MIVVAERDVGIAAMRCLSIGRALEGWISLEFFAGGKTFDYPQFHFTARNLTSER